VFDVSTPSSPTLVIRMETPGHAFGVAVSGANVCVADFAAGLQVAGRQCP
jgi:hypothetical protein